jgi:hypothetical protein
MPFFDGNDSFASFTSMMPKDIGNLPTGIPSYGFSEYLLFLDDLFYNGWMEAAQVGGMGLTFGLISVSFATRCMFMPI